MDGIRRALEDENTKLKEQYAGALVLIEMLEETNEALKKMNKTLNADTTTLRQIVADLRKATDLHKKDFREIASKYLDTDKENGGLGSANNAEVASASSSPSSAPAPAPVSAHVPSPLRQRAGSAQALSKDEAASPCGDELKIASVHRNAREAGSTPIHRRAQQFKLWQDYLHLKEQRDDVVLALQSFLGAAKENGGLGSANNDEVASASGSPAVPARAPQQRLRRASVQPRVTTQSASILTSEVPPPRQPLAHRAGASTATSTTTDAASSAAGRATTIVKPPGRPFEMCEKCGRHKTDRTYHSACYSRDLKHGDIPGGNIDKACTHPKVRKVRR